MDGVIIIFIAIFLYIKCGSWQSELQGTETHTSPSLSARLNPEMYHDECAFMAIANELGFH